MSLINPTGLKIGSIATLYGVSYRVIGRMVMSVLDGGANYYWNEFNLRGGSGQIATLVYEETIRGGEWRFFNLFKPDVPFAIADARTKLVGDRLNLDGTDVRVTFTGRSTVRLIEGTAPEGEAVGKHENYFNAEAGSRMIVASWTTSRMEFYRGDTLPAGIVERAFGIPKPARSIYAKSLYSGGGGQNYSGWLVLCVVILLFVFLGPLSCDTTRPREQPVSLIHAPASPLKVGSAGILNGHAYHIAGHCIVEIGEVGSRHERHEYTLTDDDSRQCLLVYGLKPNSRDWWLFTELHPANPLTPVQAGSKLLGQTVSVDDLNVKISDIFLSTSQPADYSASPDWGGKTVSYGFRGFAGADIVMARWNENGITFHRGTGIPAKTVLEAFKQIEPQK